jgi:hypothetical protein
MLRIRGLSFGRRGRCGVVSREREEDFFEAHSHRPQFQQSPAVRHDGARQLAADIASGFACDFEAGEAFSSIGFDDAGDASHSTEERHAKLKRSQRRAVRWLIVAGLTLLVLNSLLCMAYLFLSLALHASPY